MRELFKIQVHTSAHRLGLTYELSLLPPFSHDDYTILLFFFLIRLCVSIVQLASSCLVTLRQL